MVTVIENLRGRLNSWYVTMRKQDKDRAIEMKEEMDELVSQSRDPSLEMYFRLLEVRFHILLSNHTKALEGFAKIGSVRNLTDDAFVYCYYYFNGIFLHENKHYHDAIESYMKAKPYLLHQEDRLEKAEFQYKLGIAYYEAKQYLNALYEIEDALDLFQKEKDWVRSADCENVIATSISRLERKEEAEKHYCKALKWIERADDPRRKSIYYKNLGMLYSEQNLSESAINCLEKGCQFISEEPFGIENVGPIYLLAKEYFKTGNETKAYFWLEKGLQQTREHLDQEYLHHFRMLEAKYALGEEAFEETYKSGMNFFIQKQLWEPLMNYGKELAQHYEKKGLYEEASQYYAKAFLAHDGMKKTGTR